MATLPLPNRMMSVTELTARIKLLLGSKFAAVWVSGELTNVKRHTNGHLYLCLKEGNAKLDGIVWRGNVPKLGFEPRDGMQVEAFGDITVYEPQGRYQLGIEEMRPSGQGRLLLAYEQLKRRLTDEGLFDPARKRPLPRYPARIGLVTSPTGAAVRDVIKVLRARWPSIAIVLAPVRVQGPGAAEEIARAIERFNRHARVDVLIVGRGGGSLEDLWAFNEERVVRAIVASRIPVIAGVGHEVDWSLSDLAADARAATPSNAAEIAVRPRREVVEQVAKCAALIRRGVLAALTRRQQQLAVLLGKYGFRRQVDVIALRQRDIDNLTDRAGTAVHRRLERAHTRLGHVRARYGLREAPRLIAGVRRQRARAIGERLVPAVVEGVHRRRERYETAFARLRALSPRGVLERGYCLARGPDGTLVRRAGQLQVGALLSVEFARGEADTRVEAVRPGGADEHETQRP